jgi:hypothetical protein
MLTEEEMLICRHELARRGYRYVWYGGSQGNGFWLLARKYPPFSAQGMREEPVLIRRPEDLARYVKG